MGTTRQSSQTNGLTMNQQNNVVYEARNRTGREYLRETVAGRSKQQEEWMPTQ